MDATGLDRKQLTNWFTNARKRIWQPRYGKLPKQKIIMRPKTVPTAAPVPVRGNWTERAARCCAKIFFFPPPQTIKTEVAPKQPRPMHQIQGSPTTVVDMWANMNDPWLPPLSPLLSSSDESDEPEWRTDELAFRHAS